MKKLAVVLSTVMVFAMVAPAVAAPSISLSGNLNSQVTVDKSGASAGSQFKLNLGLQAGDKTKAVMEFGPNDQYSIVDGSRTGIPFDTTPSVLSPLSLGIKKAYVQTTGPFWGNGPEITTTLGDISVNEGQQVGDLGNRRGVKMEGIQLGPVSVEGFYAWPGGYSRMMNADDQHEFAFDAIQNKWVKYGVSNTDQVGGVKADLNLNKVQLGANVIKSNAADRPEYAVTGKVTPIDRLAIDGFYAADAANNNAYRVNASVMNVLPTVNLYAGYRGGSSAFAPMYASRADVNGSGAIEEDDWATGALAATDRKTGYNVGVETTQMGIHMRGDYDNPKDKIKLAADTEKAGFKLAATTTLVSEKFDSAEFSMEKPVILPGVDLTAKYTADMDATSNLTHEITATAKVNAIPQLKDVTLEGTVDLDHTAKVTDYKASVKYLAPNGIELGLSHSMTDGTSATAGLNVAF